MSDRPMTRDELEEIIRLRGVVLDLRADHQDSQWNALWQIIHPGDTSWEYPGQVIREVKGEIERLSQRVFCLGGLSDAGAVRVDNLNREIERLRAKMDNWRCRIGDVFHEIEGETV